MGSCLRPPNTVFIPVVIFIYHFCFAFALTALNKFIEYITKGKLNLLNYFDPAIGISSAHPVFLMSLFITISLLSFWKAQAEMTSDKN